MKKVITYGVFDYMHIGHVRLFKNIKTLLGHDTHLTVAVHKDPFVIQNKPDITLLYSQSDRVEILNAIRFIDEVVLYDQIDSDLPMRTFDILAVGPDQTNPHFLAAMEYCKENGKQIITMQRTENICSSAIRNRIISGD